MPHAQSASKTCWFVSNIIIRHLTVVQIMSPIVKLRTLRFSRSFCYVFFDSMPCKFYHEKFNDVSKVIKEIVDDFPFKYLTIYIDCCDDSDLRPIIRELNNPLHWQSTSKIISIKSKYHRVKLPLNPYTKLSALERAKLSGR